MKEYPKQLPIGASSVLYVEPGDRRFYHLRTDCRCFKRGDAENLQVIGEAQVRQRSLQPCFFCGYEPPPPPTRRERLVSVLAAPLALLSWPAGMLTVASFCIAFLVASRMYHGGTLPLWAIILVGVGILMVGALIDARYGWMDW